MHIAKNIPEVELSILSEMHTSANKHAGTSHPRLVLLDLDPEKDEHQRLGNTVIRAPKSFPLKPAIANTIANDIDDRYPSLYRHMKGEDVHTIEGIRRIVELVRDNNNVVNCTDHDELIDVILEHLSLTGVIKQSVNIRTAIVASKMIDFLGVELDDGIVPARNLLAMGFDRSYLTIPRSKSTEEAFSEDEEVLVSATNSRTTRSIGRSFKRDLIINRRLPPFVLGVAVPGTVNKPSLHDPNLTVVGRVSKGILNFTDVPNTMSVATAIRLDMDNPKVFIDEVPMKIEDINDIDRLMDRLLAGITKLDGGNYIYDRTGSIEVVQPV